MDEQAQKPVNKLAVIYRACPSETAGYSAPRSNRIAGFDKRRCFKSCWAGGFGSELIDLHIVWDGEPEGQYYDFLKAYDSKECIYPLKGFHVLSKEEGRSNKNSLKYCFDLAGKLENEYIFFTEDDYLFLPSSLIIMADALTVGYDPFTLFDHPDRYLPARNGLLIGGTDITLGHDFIGRTRTGFVRSCESTTGSFACSRKTFNLIKDDLYFWNQKGDQCMEDRKFFRYIYEEKDIRLWSQLPGYAVHCVTNDLSYHYNWIKFNNSIPI